MTETTAPADPDEAPLKSTGEPFALGPAGLEQTPSRGIEAAPGAAAPAAAVPPFQGPPQPSVAVPSTFPSPSAQGRGGVFTGQAEASPSRSSSPSGLRALAFFLIFLLAGGSATWAITPPPTRDWWVASLRDSAEAYAGYIDKHQQDERAKPYVEKATYFKADKTGSLADLRTYQRQYPRGQYREKVVEKVLTLETRALVDIQRQPEAGKVRRFVADFPESERLPALKQAVETRAELRAELMPVLENAYVRSLEEHPSAQKVTAYLRDFPRRERLADVARAAAARPEVLRQVQPAIEEAAFRKVEAASTPEQVRDVLPVLENAGSTAAAARVEQIVDRKPQLKKQLQDQLQQTRRRILQREAAGAPGRTPEFWMMKPCRV